MRYEPPLHGSPSAGERGGTNLNGFTRLQRGGNNLNGFTDFRSENGSSQGLYLALTVLYLPSEMETNYVLFYSLKSPGSGSGLNCLIVFQISRQRWGFHRANEHGRVPARNPNFG